MIAHGSYDVSTPLDNAIELAPYFKKGRLIVVHGGSHPAIDDAMDANPEFAKALLTFARTGETSALPNEVRLPAIRFEVSAKQ